MVRAGSHLEGKRLVCWGACRKKGIFPKLPHLPLAVSRFATLTFPIRPMTNCVVRTHAANYFTLASLPCKKGAGCLWKEDMLWYTLLKIQVALTASTTPLILLAEKAMSA